MKTKTKKKVARKSKIEPWRAELKRIVRFLNKKDKQSDNLWLVLSAFRGPDKSEINKNATTGVIRHAAGLKPLNYAAVSNTDSQLYAAARVEQKYNGEHFYYHSRTAFEILGLKWDEVNK